MKKLMVVVSKEKSNMTESDGRGRKNTENRSERRPILWYNTQYSDRISRSLCPLSFRTVEANDYRAALLLFYEQNNISAFKKMFLEQIEFAMKEYF